MTLYIEHGGQRYGVDLEAFGRRVLALVTSRNWTSLAAAQTSISNANFTAGGFLAIKKILTDLIVGSVYFPADFTASATPTPTLTAIELAARNVSGTIT